MNEFTRRLPQEKTAEVQLAELKADRWDSMFFPSQLAFGVVERAFRRGFVHALNAIVAFAEDVPPEFRAWVNANLAIYHKWRDDFRFGRTNNETMAPRRRCYLIARRSSEKRVTHSPARTVGAMRILSNICKVGMSCVHDAPKGKHPTSSESHKH